MIVDRWKNRHGKGGVSVHVWWPFELTVTWLSDFGFANGPFWFEVLVILNLALWLLIFVHP
jgi:hypothetical protein